MRRAFLLLLLLLLVPSARAARGLEAELKPAQRALSAGDYAKAYALYARHAARNPLARFTLGLFYREGWGRPRDEVQACRHFEKAARAGIPAAQQFFGDCLAGGVGRAADGEAAVGWYLKAAASGIPFALCSAGGLYIRGAGVEKDIPRGLALCTRAAQADSPPAMLMLADYFRTGAEVPRDLPAARRWYREAAERRVREAQYRLGLMLAEGAGGEPDPGAALFWLESAAAGGYAPAYLPTAILYANARPDPKTGALAPEHLAKVYLWTAAAKATTTDPQQLEAVSRLEAGVLAAMPATWRPELDRKVAEHLAKHGP